MENIFFKLHCVKVYHPSCYKELIRDALFCCCGGGFWLGALYGLQWSLVLPNGSHAVSSLRGNLSRPTSRWFGKGRRAIPRELKWETALWLEPWFIWPCLCLKGGSRIMCISQGFGCGCEILLVLWTKTGEMLYLICMSRIQPILMNGGKPKHLVKLGRKKAQPRNLGKVILLHCKGFRRSHCL